MENGTAASAAADETAKQQRERSTIQFPYNDLDEAITVANAMYSNVGAGTAELHQLAGWMDQALTSGAFRNKVSAARMFGLIETGQGRVTLTKTGREIVNADTAAAARVNAFLAVALYGAIFDKYKGQPLPPNVGLEREMADLGVAEKQKDRARQAFQRSAEQAGFFRQGKNKLILPAVGGLPLEPPPPDKGGGPGDGDGGGDGGNLHPLIRGLVETLPDPGTEWADEDQNEWLDAARANFRLIYRRPKRATTTTTTDPSERQPLS
ncbi:MAG TPA: hypothetical protein VH720_05705 [Candidatus Limnocylindrales bacterium]